MGLGKLTVISLQVPPCQRICRMICRWPDNFFTVMPRKGAVAYACDPSLVSSEHATGVVDRGPMRGFGPLAQAGRYAPSGFEIGQPRSYSIRGEATRRSNAAQGFRRPIG